MASKIDTIDRKLDVLSGAQTNSGLLNRMDKKLDLINEKLDTLTGQSGSVATDTSGGSGGDDPETSSGGGGEHETIEVNEEQEDYPYGHCVNLISVEKTPAGDGNRFTIKFTKNTDKINYRFHQNGGVAKSPESVVEGDGGVWSVSFTSQWNITSPQQHPVWFAVGDEIEEKGWSFMKTRHMLYLELNNSPENYTVQDIDSLPVAHVDPPRAAVYEPGEDFNATAYFTLNNEKQQVPYIFESLEVINMTDGEIFMDMGGEDIIRDVKHDAGPNYTTMETVTVLSSSTPVCGYLSFGTSLQLQGPVVNRVQINRVIEVRPSTQSTALPPNYLGIFNTPGSSKSSNGHELKECRAGEECNLNCYGVGEAISDIDVVRVLSNGSHEPVLSAVKPDLPGGMDAHSFRVIAWNFSARTDSGDSDGLTTFQCSVTDNTRGLVVTKLVDVLVMLEDGIDEERSNVTVRDGYMDPYIKHLTFNCAVYGRPLPEVTFSGGTSYIFNMDSSEPDSVVSTGENQAVAIKNITISIDYLQEYNYELHPDDILPYCGFYSRSQQEYVEYTFDVPDLGL